MTEINRTGLKERIVISDAFTAEERTFLLDAINAMPDFTDIRMHRRRNYMGRIESIWAYLSIDEGGEGVCAAPLGNGQTLPMIAADKTRLDQLKPVAVAIAKKIGVPIRLARFKQREDVEIIRP